MDDFLNFINLHFPPALQGAAEKPTLLQYFNIFNKNYVFLVYAAKKWCWGNITYLNRLILLIPLAC